MNDFELIYYESLEQTRKSEIALIEGILKGIQIICIILVIIFFFKIIKGFVKKDKKMLLKYFLLNIFPVGILVFLDILNKFAIVDKPIIYIYPKKKQKVKVKLTNQEKLTCTYPKYNDGWEVIAEPNGDLVDCNTGRKLYALYWESRNEEKMKIEKGFCVKGEDSAIFLEEKLALLGLNEREAEEFIVYWLPKLESNPYNIIKFETIENINEIMPLEIEPKPDSLIRVLMVYKKSKKYIEIEKQDIITPKRESFTVVEWGGTEVV